MKRPPIVSVVGQLDSGKITLVEGLIRELKRRGYPVGTIKHDAHSFQIDHPGTDTWRHAQAGSDQMVISSPQRVASIRRVERELTLAELAEAMPDVDIILTEGYRRGDAPKIEVSRRARSQPLGLRRHRHRRGRRGDQGGPPPHHRTPLQCRHAYRYPEPKHVPA